jgi:hypothetical protein
MKALKAWFLSLHTREKLLLTGFVALVAVLWAGTFGGRMVEFWSKESATLARLRRQAAVLASRDAVEQRAREASAKLVPGESLSSQQLQAKVDQIARQAGIRNPSLNGVPADPSAGNSNLVIHTLNAQFSNVTWNALVASYTELLKLRPYIAIDQMTVNLTDQRTQLHNVQMRLSSIEVRP